VSPAERDAAFERDVLALLPDVARFARSLARDAADADDLTQETILQAYRGYHTFRAGSDVRRWLFTICRNAFLRGRRRDARLVETERGDEAELESYAAAFGHALAERRGEAQLLDRIDVGPAIRRAMDALPPAFRVAVALVDVEGLSYEEVAAVEGVPIGTVRSRLFRVRRLLQERLLEHARDAGLAPPHPDDPLEIPS
jgi:RNA polymerase sigma-70 factor, ECF subfamily